ncbi:MAG TPA: hypothetical protein VMV07_26085 [Streptosporangiaceae bacterium]|nr:hypothetical protein [Streptosporangiaceae bacterium]
MRSAALTPQNLHPAAYFPGDAVRKGCDASLDGAFDGVALAAGVGGDHVFTSQELKYPAAPAGERPDGGLVDGGIRPDPGQQDPRCLGSGMPGGGVPALRPGVPLEFLQQGLGARSERGQLVQFAGGQAGPVAADLEQRGLRGIDQVR